MSSPRPLTGLMLKSLGDSLRSRIPGARVLDLFAGKGSFSKMCLKEGAVSVLMVERDKSLIRELREIGPVAAEDVFSFLKRDGEFDVILADPPYGSWGVPFTNSLCDAVKPRLSKGGIFLVKLPKRVVISGFKELKHRDFGETRILYLERLE